MLILIFISSCKKATNLPGGSASACLLTESEQSLIHPLNEQFAYPFAAADPAVTDPLLDPLLDYVGDAHFVGMGESTHGTKEFYQLKDKLFRGLVQQKGFKAIVFEIPWGNAMVVNDFVTQGIGTADEVIDQTYYWTYDTQEVRALAQWIHDYNTGLPEVEKILFVGCDPQGGDFKQERSIIAHFLDQAQPDSLSRVWEYYANLPNELNKYSSASAAILEANREGTQKAYDYFLNNKDGLIASTSVVAYEVALMATHVIQQRELIYRTNDFGEKRDSLMAIYSEWWQRILGDNAKVALWAHNFHVAYGADFNANFMGTFLRQRHPDTYKNIGFSFGKGSFNAFLAGRNRQFQSGVQRQNIPKPKCHTINHLLSEVEGDRHYLIIEELRNEVFTYFNTPQSFVQFGAGFNYSYLDNYILEVRLARRFDIIIHFDATHASVLQ